MTLDLTKNDYSRVRIQANRTATETFSYYGTFDVKPKLERSLQYIRKLYLFLILQLYPELTTI